MKLHLEFYIILFMFPHICIAKKEQKLQIFSVSKPDDCSIIANNGDIVAVHYTGKLENGQIFDASKEQPIKFQLGVGKVIQGWDKGIQGMCVGEKRKLVIPPDLAYGARGVAGVIPAHATLTFDAELVSLEKQSALSPNNIEKLLNIVIWPVVIIGIVVILYKRMSAAEEQIKSQKSEKKSRKKKH